MSSPFSDVCHLYTSYEAYEGKAKEPTDPKLEFCFESYNLLSSALTAVKHTYAVNPDRTPNIYTMQGHNPVRKQQILCHLNECMQKDEILCVQEFDEGFRAEFEVLLDKHAYGCASVCYGVFKTGDKQINGYLGAGILIPSKHFELIESTHIKYAIPEVEESFKLASQEFVAVRLNHRETSTRLVIASAHIPFGVKNKTFVVDGLFASVQAFANGDPVMLAGDMNIDARVDPTVINAGKSLGFKDVLQDQRPNIITAVSCFGKDPTIKHSAVDYIMSKDLSVVSEKVETDAFLSGGEPTIPNRLHPSDHFPVRGVVTFVHSEKRAVKRQCLEMPK